MTGPFRPAQINTFISSPFSKINTTQTKVYLFFIWNSIVVLTSHKKSEMLVNKRASVGEHKAFITNEFQIISGGDHEMFREGKKGGWISNRRGSESLMGNLHGFC